MYLADYQFEEATLAYLKSRFVICLPGITESEILSHQELYFNLSSDCSEQW